MASLIWRLHDQNIIICLDMNNFKTRWLQDMKTCLVVCQQHKTFKIVLYWNGTAYPAQNVIAINWVRYSMFSVTINIYAPSGV